MIWEGKFFYWSKKIPIQQILIRPERTSISLFIVRRIIPLLVVTITILAHSTPGNNLHPLKISWHSPSWAAITMTPPTAKISIVKIYSSSPTRPFPYIQKKTETEAISAKAKATTTNKAKGLLRPLSTLNYPRLPSPSMISS